jgi:hypothetical protein
MALASRFDDLGNVEFKMDCESVALVNRLIASESTQVYSQTDNWSWQMDDGRIGNWQDYVDQCGSQSTGVTDTDKATHEAL